MLHRRDAMLRLGQIGLGGLTLPQLVQQRQLHAAAEASGTAKACILIYLWGGPPQQDMWDMKPDAPLGVRSLFQPIPTVVPGIDVCEHMPNFARHTDKVALIRSLSHDSNNHEPSVYRTLTGHINNTLAVPRNQRSRRDAPNIGSVVSYFTPPFGAMPAAVTIPRPIGHDGSTYAGTYAGFLGGQHDPMEVAAAEETPEKPTHPVTLPPEMAETRLLARQGLLSTVEQVERQLEKSRSLKDLDNYRQQAFSMLSSPAAKRAFRIEFEDQQTRDRYGRNEWGEAILLARRLVEAGVKLVTISWMYIQKGGNVANVWDNHGPFEGHTGTEMLKQVYCLPSLDQGIGALLDDLSGSGLLDETLVAMWGEFGRTPNLNQAGGRDHWGAVQTACLAGGGIRGGQIYGASDKFAAYPTTAPVSPEDMLATVYHALGIDPEGTIRDPLNRPVRVVEGTPLTGLF